jgi:hypothetical protein
MSVSGKIDRKAGDHPCDGKMGGGTLDSGTSFKTGFHDEQVLPDPDMKGNQRPRSAPMHEVPGGQTIKG